MTSKDIAHHFVQLDEIRMHYAEAKPEREDAPLVVLLHGFPEFWYSWRHQLTALRDAGYWVVAPDLRGYAQTDKPHGVQAYTIEKLTGDIAQLITALGRPKACIVGHDWGGALAWWHAMLHPEQVERLSVLNCPHPGHQSAMMMDPAQLKRSAYIFYFQLPVFPERRLNKHKMRYLNALFFGDPQRADAFSEADVAQYARALDPATIEAALNYYRAYIRRGPQAHKRQLQAIDAPTQVIWGTDDKYLGQRYAQPPTRWVWDVRVELLEGVSHWVQVDAADEVNRRLIAFLPSPSA